MKGIGVKEKARENDSSRRQSSRGERMKKKKRDERVKKRGKEKTMRNIVRTYINEASKRSSTS